MFTMIRNSLMSLLLFTVVTGLIYPLVVTGLAQAIFPSQANGSVITKNGKAVGSTLIGQQFEDQKYFWGRLSATSPYPYNGGASSGSNLGQNNPALMTNIEGRIKALHEAEPGNTAKIPVDLVTASGSGLDPHISQAAAEYQVNRVAKTRGIDQTSVRTLIAKHTQGRWIGLLGEPVVNVLELNLELDGQKQQK
jgi:K+-transporting ATPase ATPase C chain